MASADALGGEIKGIVADRVEKIQRISSSSSSSGEEEAARTEKTMKVEPTAENRGEKGDKETTPATRVAKTKAAVKNVEKLLALIREASGKEKSGKIAFLREDQVAVKNATFDIQSQVQRLMLIILEMGEDTRKAEEGRRKAVEEAKNATMAAKVSARLGPTTGRQTETRKENNHNNNAGNNNNNKTGEQRTVWQGARPRTGIWANQREGATLLARLEEERRVSFSRERGRQQGSVEKGATGGWTKVASKAERLRKGTEEIQETMVKMTGKTGEEVKAMLNQKLDLEEMGGPLEKVVVRKDGSVILVSKTKEQWKRVETQEGMWGGNGSQGGPQIATDGDGDCRGKDEGGGSRGGALAQKQLDQRRSHEGGISRGLQVSGKKDEQEGSKEGETDVLRGAGSAENDGGKRETSGGPDKMLRGGNRRGHPVLQVQRVWSSVEGVQGRTNLHQVRRRGSQEQRVSCGGEMLQLCQGRSERRPSRDVPRVSDLQETSGGEDEQDSQVLVASKGWSLNVFQVNVGRGREATDEVRRTVEEKDVDVVLVQEPYRRMSAWPGWIRFGGESDDKVATMVRAKHRPIDLAQFSGSNMRTTAVEDVTGEKVVFVNIYVPPGGSLGVVLTKTEQLLRDHRRRVVVGGDFNAKHEAWGGETTDGRGSRVMDLVGGANLTIANDRNSRPTFETANGRSWIDVTLFKNIEVEDWKVREEETMSDHKVIAFRVRADDLAPTEGEKRMMVGRADCEAFRESARATFSERRDQQRGRAEEEAVFLQEAAMKACRVSIPSRKKKSGPRTTWWNGEH